MIINFICIIIDKITMIVIMTVTMIIIVSIKILMSFFNINIIGIVIVIIY